MNDIQNECRLIVEAKSINESFCRACIGAFASQLDPNLEELSDIKTAVSEAVTNCIVHAYPDVPGKIEITARIRTGNNLQIRIKDTGVGIADIEKARTPLYTTSQEERSGLGFTVMESFSDRLTVKSKPMHGTIVTIEKRIIGKR